MELLRQTCVDVATTWVVSPGLSLESGARAELARCVVQVAKVRVLPRPPTDQIAMAQACKEAAEAIVGTTRCVPVAYCVSNAALACAQGCTSYT